MLPVTPAGGNTDRIPYQLRSGSGANGAVWGNTATATQTGNGVGGTGSGLQQNYNIYATVPSADYHYGDYQDTVTVQVNY
ncbi:spore coat protein U domain-containing protein [Neisseria dentiae]|uniref:spore coat protein U domain-containing protein n=1 Tax=Neisseria dentiae TaxID=194197 RepID=UPI00359FEF8A